MTKSIYKKCIRCNKKRKLLTIHYLITGKGLVVIEGVCKKCGNLYIEELIRGMKSVGIMNTDFIDEIYYLNK